MKYQFNRLPPFTNQPGRTKLYQRREAIQHRRCKQKLLSTGSHYDLLCKLIMSYRTVSVAVEAAGYTQDLRRKFANGGYFLLASLH